MIDRSQMRTTSMSYAATTRDSDRLIAQTQDSADSLVYSHFHSIYVEAERISEPMVSPTSFFAYYDTPKLIFHSTRRIVVSSTAKNT